MLRKRKKQMAQDNDPLWEFARSLIITSMVSLVIGGGIGLVMHSWVAGVILFIVVTVAQFAATSIIRELSDRRNQKAEFLAEQVLREAAQRKLPYDLNCAYCSTLNRIGISFTEENIFDCTKCKQPNKVYIQFSTIRITTPLTPKENADYIDMDADPGVTQSTINESIKVN